MPQLSLDYLFSQIFWLLLCFGVIYFYMRFIDKKFKSILSQRDHIVSVDKTLALQKQLESYQDEYNQNKKYFSSIVLEMTKEENSKMLDFEKEEEGKFLRKVEALNEKFRKEMNVIKNTISSEKFGILASNAEIIIKNYTDVDNKKLEQIVSKYND